MKKEIFILHNSHSNKVLIVRCQKLHTFLLGYVWVSVVSWVCAPGIWTLDFCHFSFVCFFHTVGGTKCMNGSSVFNTTATGCSLLLQTLHLLCFAIMDRHSKFTSSKKILFNQLILLSFLSFSSCIHIVREDRTQITWTLSVLIPYGFWYSNSRNVPASTFTHWNIILF